jgi:hypothetical protein
MKQDGRPATREEVEQQTALVGERLRELEAQVAASPELSEQFRRRYREDRLSADPEQTFGESELLFHLAEARYTLFLNERTLKAGTAA